MLKKPDPGLLILIVSVGFIAILMTVNQKAIVADLGELPSPHNGCQWINMGEFEITEDVQQEVISCKTYIDNYNPYSIGYMKITKTNDKTETFADKCVDYKNLEEYSCINPTTSLKSTGTCTQGCNNNKCNGVGKLICG
ncbi:hypothetical protein HQ529_02105 [Candidatus Woesearchaeota archaeon]|nr:hypothetical protein [Candidatus Woesearchaeota archaeon]